LTIHDVYAHECLLFVLISAIPCFADPDHALRRKGDDDVIVVIGGLGIIAEGGESLPAYVRKFGTGRLVARSTVRLAPTDQPTATAL